MDILDEIYLLQVNQAPQGNCYTEPTVRDATKRQTGKPDQTQVSRDRLQPRDWLDRQQASMTCLDEERLDLSSQLSSSMVQHSGVTGASAASNPARLELVPTTAFPSAVSTATHRPSYVTSSSQVPVRKAPAAVVGHSQHPVFQAEKPGFPSPRGVQDGLFDFESREEVPCGAPARSAHGTQRMNPSPRVWVNSSVAEPGAPVSIPSAPSAAPVMEMSHHHSVSSLSMVSHKPVGNVELPNASRCISGHVENGDTTSYVNDGTSYSDSRREHTVGLIPQIARSGSRPEYGPHTTSAPSDAIPTNDTQPLQVSSQLHVDTPQFHSQPITPWLENADAIGVENDAPALEYHRRTATPLSDPNMHSDAAVVQQGGARSAERFAEFRNSVSRDTVEAIRVGVRAVPKESSSVGLAPTQQCTATVDFPSSEAELQPLHEQVSPSMSLASPDYRSGLVDADAQSLSMSSLRSDKKRKSTGTPVMPPTAKSILERREKAIREGRRHEAKLSDEERRILRRLRNRESAERCARRKQEQASVLAKRITHLEKENVELRGMAEYYEREIRALESVLYPTRQQGSMSSA